MKDKRYIENAHTRKRRVEVSESPTHKLQRLPCMATKQSGFKLSVEELEQKKTSLPYLKQIEYINAELRMRGVGKKKVKLIKFNKTVEAGKDCRIEMMEGDKGHHGNQLEDEHSKKRKTRPYARKLTAIKSPEKQESLSKLSVKYARFCETILNLNALAPKVRSYSWLLRLIEEIFDARYQHEIERGRDAKKSIMPVAMPHFTRNFIRNTLGVPSIADQESLDFLYNIERSANDFLEVNLFSYFLREIYDEDSLLFYLHLRHTTQQEFGLSLKLKQKLLHPNATKKFHADGTIVLKAHPLIHDGSQLVHLSKHACKRVTTKFLRSSKGTNYLIEQKFPECFTTVKTESGSQNALKADAIKEQQIIEVTQYFKAMLLLFRDTSADIVAKFKCHDDGDMLTSLGQLQQTMKDEDSIQELKKHAEAQSIELKSAESNLLKFTRALSSNPDNSKIKAAHFFATNEAVRKRQNYLETQNTMSNIENRVNATWDNVMQTKKKSPVNKRSKYALPRKIESVLQQYTHWVYFLEHKFVVKVKAKSQFQASWKRSMQSLQEKSAICIQRNFRASRAYRAERLQNRRIEEKSRAARQKKKELALLQRKRLEQRREKDAEKHRERMGEMKRKQDDAKIALAARQSKLLVKHNQNEAERKLASYLATGLAYTFQLWKKSWMAGQQLQSKRKAYSGKLFFRWKGYYFLRTLRKRSARKIQAAFRGKQERIRHSIRKKVANSQNDKARRLILKIKNRGVSKVFASWIALVDRSRQIKLNMLKWKCRAAICILQAWHQYCLHVREEREINVVQIQRVYRGRLGRHYSARKSYEKRCATTIQRIYRGYMYRKRVSMMRKLNASQLQKVENLCKRLMNRNIYACFHGLQRYAVLQRQIRSLSLRCSMHLVGVVYVAWKQYYIFQAAERKALLDLQCQSCVKIQSMFRTFRMRKHFKQIFIDNHAAIVIQSIARMYLAKKYTAYCRLKIEKAFVTQRIYRGKLGRRLAHYRRVEVMLECVSSGNFIAMNQYFENEFAWNVDESGTSVFHVACEVGSKKMIKLCLRYGMEPTIYDYYGRTPLHTTALSTYSHRASIIEYLITHGAWHEAIDFEGCTPLILASQWGHTDCVEALLFREADVSISNAQGFNAIQLAVSYGYCSVVQAILEKSQDPVHVNLADGATLVHDCAANGFDDILELLMKYNVPLNDQDNEGNTPMHYATSNLKHNIISALVVAGVCPDTKNYIGRSPIMLAAADGSEEILTILAESNANLNAQDEEGDTALHIAIYALQTKCCELLLSFGANLHVINSFGNQALHAAAQHNHENIVKKLLDYNADVNIKNYDGHTPSGLARLENHLSIVDIILERFTEVEVSNVKRRRSLSNIQESDLNRSDADWQKAKSLSIPIGTIGEWEDFMDIALGHVFYHNTLTNDYTWEVPAEYDASLGNVWHYEKNSSTSKYEYVNRRTGDRRTNPPQIDPERLQLAIQQRGRRKELRKKISVGHASATSTADYKSFWNYHAMQNKAAKSEHAAILILQRNSRRYIAGRQLKQLKRERKSIILLQTIYRGRLARRTAVQRNKENQAAIVVQTQIRGVLTRKSEIYMRHTREEHRYRLRKAIDIQRCYRGHVDRKRFRHRKAQKCGPVSYFQWNEVRLASPIKETFNVWEKRLLQHTKDVMFYSHQVTGECAWEIPVIWKEHNYEQFLERQQNYYDGYTIGMVNAAVKLQTMWRARITKVNYKILLKSIRIMNSCENAYLEEPDNLQNLCNYMVHMHVIRHEYDIARPLYQKAMEVMENRGPDVAFILFNYAIFSVATHLHDFDTVCSYIQRAVAADPLKKTFLLAHLGFYRYSLLKSPQNTDSNLNFAICSQLIYDDYDLAREHYFRALEANPHNGGIMDDINNLLLQSNNTEISGFELFLEWQQNDAAIAAENRKAQDAVKAHEVKLNNAAKLLQSVYRSRHTRKKMIRIAALTNNINLKLEENEANAPDYKIICEAVRRISIQADGTSIDVRQLAMLFSLLNMDISESYEIIIEELIACAKKDIIGKFAQPRPISQQEFFLWWIKGESLDDWEIAIDDTGNTSYKYIPMGTMHQGKPRFRYKLSPLPVLLGDGWEKHKDEAGTVYFYNSTTGESSWQRPDVKPCQVSDSTDLENAYASIDSKGKGYIYQFQLKSLLQALENKDYQNDNDLINLMEQLDISRGGMIQKTDFLSFWRSGKSEWQTIEDGDGNIYYYNAATGESSWENPALLGSDWNTVDDGEGNIYYYNAITGETTWELP